MRNVVSETKKWERRNEHSSARPSTLYSSPANRSSADHCTDGLKRQHADISSNKNADLSVAARSAQISGGAQKNRCTHLSNGSQAFLSPLWSQEVYLQAFKHIVVASCCDSAVTWNFYCHFTSKKGSNLSLPRCASRIPGDVVYEASITMAKN